MIGSQGHSCLKQGNGEEQGAEGEEGKESTLSG